MSCREATGIGGVGKRRWLNSIYITVSDICLHGIDAEKQTARIFRITLTLNRRTEALEITVERHEIMIGQPDVSDSVREPERRLGDIRSPRIGNIGAPIFQPKTSGSSSEMMKPPARARRPSPFSLSQPEAQKPKPLGLPFREKQTIPMRPEKNLESLDLQLSEKTKPVKRTTSTSTNSSTMTPPETPASSQISTARPISSQLARNPRAPSSQTQARPPPSSESTRARPPSSQTQTQTRPPSSQRTPAQPETIQSPRPLQLKPTQTTTSRSYQDEPSYLSTPSSTAPLPQVSTPSPRRVTRSSSAMPPPSLKRAAPHSSPIAPSTPTSMKRLKRTIGGDEFPLNTPFCSPSLTITNRIQTSDFRGQTPGQISPLCIYNVQMARMDVNGIVDPLSPSLPKESYYTSYEAANHAWMWGVIHVMQKTETRGWSIECDNLSSSCTYDGSEERELLRVRFHVEEDEGECEYEIGVSCKRIRTTGQLYSTAPQKGLFPSGERGRDVRDLCFRDANVRKVDDERIDAVLVWIGYPDDSEHAERAEDGPECMNEDLWNSIHKVFAEITMDRQIKIERIDRVEID